MYLKIEASLWIVESLSETCCVVKDRQRERERERERDSQIFSIDDLNADSAEDSMTYQSISFNKLLSIF